jgi:hypothetical protein
MIHYQNATQTEVQYETKIPTKMKYTIRLPKRSNAVSKLVLQQ